LPLEERLDLSTLEPSSVLYRYTRHVALMLTDDAGLPDAPGAVAFVRTKG
jgi:hypothetical protein